MISFLHHAKVLGVAMLASTLLPVATSHPPMTAELRERIKELRHKAYDHPEEAQEFFLKKRLPVGAKILPIVSYTAARSLMEDMAQQSMLHHQQLPTRREAAAQGLQNHDSAVDWSNVGPGNIGGRTRGLVIDPTAPTTMYAAAVDGGVWKTTNGGQNWAPTTDLLSNIATNSLVMDPADAQVLFAGTGEGYFNEDAANGLGIYTTRDGAATWNLVPGTATADFLFVNHIEISPSTGMLYAATNSGVMRLDQKSGTWTRIFTAVPAPKQFGGCLDLRIRSSDLGHTSPRAAAHDVAFVSCGTFSQAQVLQNKSADTNGKFTVVLSVPEQGRTSLAIAPSNPAVIYALAARNDNGPRGEYNQGLLGVFRSTEGGDAGTWTTQNFDSSGNRLNTRLLSNAVIANLVGCGFGGPNGFENQGWYDNVIAVDPTNENRVWAGGIDLFRSDDGGKNWGEASYWWVQGESPAYAHADHHVVVFDPGFNGTTNRRMFDGGDGGVFVTDDALASTAHGKGAECDPSNTAVVWSSLNSTYTVTQFYSGSIFPGGSAYFGGAQDNGTSAGNDQSGANNWSEILGGDGGFTALDPTKTQNLYAENTGLSIAFSPDSGVDWFDATRGIAESPFDFMFINPFIMDPNAPTRLWTGGLFAWRTDDGGANWSRASRLIPGPVGNQASAWAVAPGNSDKVLMGTTVGFIANTQKGTTSTGKTFWGSAFPQEGFVSSVAFDPQNLTTVYATYSSFQTVHVVVSHDGGGHWSSLAGKGAGALPDVPTNCIFIDPANSRNLWIGTDLGIFTSTDGGGHWAVEATAFPNTRVEAFAFDMKTRTLLAFTHGRGAFKAVLPAG
jgi:hypothetical protein